jgi:thioredoxin-like negative regulator of GroEL
MSNPNYSEDTEWNDILRQKGIIPELEITQEQIEELVDETIRERNQLENKTLDELDLLLEDAQDQRVIEKYRQDRLREIQNAKLFGTIQEISKPQYEDEITKASKNTWIVVILYQSHIMESNKLIRQLEGLARRYKETKFIKIKADSCIENYPDRNVPTVLVYGDGTMQKQWVALKADSQFEQVLKNMGALGRAYDEGYDVDQMQGYHQNESSSDSEWD